MARPFARPSPAASSATTTWSGRREPRSPGPAWPTSRTAVPCRTEPASRTWHRPRIRPSAECWHRFVRGSISLRDFEEIQAGPRGRSFRPQDNTTPPNSPSSSTSDVAFPVLELEPEPQPARRIRVRPCLGVIARMGLGRRMMRTKTISGCIEDQGDIEILADEASFDEHGTGSTGAAEKQATTQPAVPGRSSEAHSRRVESRTVAEPHDRWEPSQDDLDLDVIEGSRSSHVALPVVHSRDRDGPFCPPRPTSSPRPSSRCRDPRLRRSRSWIWPRWSTSPFNSSFSSW